MGRIGFTEIIFTVLIIVLLFGAKRLPEIGEAIGKAIREFKKASRETGGSLKAAIEDKHDENKS